MKKNKALEIVTVYGFNVKLDTHGQTPSFLNLPRFFYFENTIGKNNSTTTTTSMPAAETEKNKIQDFSQAIIFIVYDDNHNNKFDRRELNISIHNII